MPTCKHCGDDNEAADLDHHDHGGREVVRCPSCGSVMGSWRDPSSARKPGK